MIELIDVSKKYSKNDNALSNINLTFESQKIYGLLGRNGAGKSTFMNLLANRIFPSTGTIKIDNKSLNSKLDLCKSVHLLSEENYYNTNIKIIDHFNYIEMINDNFNYQHALSLAKKFGLNINNKLKELSTGYLTAFKICVALAMDVKHLLLDEPTKGLDANHRQLFYALLLEYYQKHLNTIIISSHIIDEITNIIEEVIIIQAGSIITNSNVELLLNEAFVISGRDRLVKEYIKDMSPILVDKQAYITTAYLLESLSELDVTGLTIEKISLQDLFIALTKEGEH